MAINAPVNDDFKNADQAIQPCIHGAFKNVDQAIQPCIHGAIKYVDQAIQPCIRYATLAPRSSSFSNEQKRGSDRSVSYACYK